MKFGANVSSGFCGFREDGDDGHSRCVDNGAADVAADITPLHRHPRNAWCLQDPQSRSSVNTFRMSSIFSSMIPARLVVVLSVVFRHCRVLLQVGDGDHLRCLAPPSLRNRVWLLAHHPFDCASPLRSATRRPAL